MGEHHFPTTELAKNRIPSHGHACTLDVSEPARTWLNHCTWTTALPSPTTASSRPEGVRQAVSSKGATKTTATH
jgi:hypothetical protein